MLRSNDIAERMNHCFIQPCFVRVVNEDLMKWLGELGYYDIWSGGIHSSEVKTITWVKDCCWGLTGFEPDTRRENFIDCGENTQLFISLASLRNDTDRYQWFTDGTLWELVESDLPSHYMQLEGHKATVDELIEHFKGLEGGLFKPLEERNEEFFNVSREDYESIIGKSFTNEDQSIVLRVLGLPKDEEDYCFLYEEYSEDSLGEWNSKDYIWLQNETDPKYESYRLTPDTEMNIASENMYHLGKDGNLYVDYSCGGDYEMFNPIPDEIFEEVKSRVIRN